MIRALGIVVRRALAAWFPSVPPADQAIVLAAMENPYPQTPTHGPGGEAGPWVGQTPEGEDGAPAPVVAVEATKTPRPPVPAREDLPTYRPHPCHRWEFADGRLATLLDRWGGHPA